MNKYIDKFMNNLIGFELLDNSIKDNLSDKHN